MKTFNEILKEAKNKYKLEDIYTSHLNFLGYECYRKKGEPGYHPPRNFIGDEPARFKREDKINTRFSHFVRGMRRLLKNFLQSKEDKLSLDQVREKFKKYLNDFHKQNYGDPCDKYDFGSWAMDSYEDRQSNRITDEEIEEIGRER